MVHRGDPGDLDRGRRGSKPLPYAGSLAEEGSQKLEIYQTTEMADVSIDV